MTGLKYRKLQKGVLSKLAIDPILAIHVCADIFKNSPLYFICEGVYVAEKTTTPSLTSAHLLLVPFLLGVAIVAVVVDISLYYLPRLDYRSAHFGTRHPSPPLDHRDRAGIAPGALVAAVADVVAKNKSFVAIIAIIISRALTASKVPKLIELWRVTPDRRVDQNEWRPSPGRSTF